MSLFGAATSGVDPQSGSYLNKEQRIAMFRASQGRGGAGGGSNSSKKKKPAVDPQSQIVVVRKNFSAAIRTVQEQAQETTNTVASQVSKNRQDIEALYNLISAEKRSELQAEKADTRDAKLERESILRKAREKLVEGMSSALAGLASIGKNIAEKALSPAKSLLGKILEALKLLAGAWAINNLPSILDGIRDFLDGLPKTKAQFVESITNIRGTWSWLDNALGGVKKLIGRIASSAFDVAGKIFRKAVDIGKKIFTSIKRFVVNLVSGIVNRLKPIIKGLWQKVNDALRPPKIQGPDLPKGMDPKLDSGKPSPKGDMSLPKGTNPDFSGDTGKGYTDASGKPVDAKPKGKGNFLQRSGEWLTEQKNKLFQKVSDAVGGAGGNAANIDNAGAAAMDGSTPTPAQTKATAEGLEELTKSGTGKTVENITNMFRPIFKHLPDAGAGFKKGIKSILGVLGRIPGIGWAIDTALNVMDGQGLVESLIRGFGSNLAGAGGWVAGAKIGGLAGTAIAPGPGSLIGALAGGIIGSIFAGAAGDQLFAGVYEGVTGKERTDTRPLGTDSINNITETLTGSKLPGYTPPKPKPTPEVPPTPVTPKSSMTTKESKTTLSKTTGDTNVSTTTETTGQPIELPAIEEQKLPETPAVAPQTPAVGKDTTKRTEHNHSAHSEENLVTKEATDLTSVPLGNAVEQFDSPPPAPSAPMSPTTGGSEAVTPVAASADRTPTPDTAPDINSVIETTGKLMDNVLGTGLFKAISGKGPSPSSMLSKATGGISTPGGMTGSSGSRSSTTVINMPPNVKTVSSGQQQQAPPQSSEGAPIPTFPTRDPESNGYRRVSARYYKLAF